MWPGKTGPPFETIPVPVPMLRGMRMLSGREVASRRSNVLDVQRAALAPDRALAKDSAVIKFELLKDEGILHVVPAAALEAKDFADLAQAVDPYLEEHGPLNGLVIEAESFPGWTDFASLISHFRFVKDHHRKIRKVAAVTDSDFLAILPSVASHFVDAQVRHFPFADKSEAMAWIRQ